MKNLKRILGALLILVFFWSCSSDDNDIEFQTESKHEFIRLNETEIITFGRFYGKCIGNNCIDIFKLEGKLLLEDKEDNYPNREKFYQGEFVEFKGVEKIDLEVIHKNFPIELLNPRVNSGVFGNPDAADGGGLYLEYLNTGVRKFWLIDLRKQNVPKFLHSYIDTVSHKINEINKINKQY